MISAKDDIDFWSRQMSEHALFMHLGLESAPFKGDALKLHQAWERLRVAVAPMTAAQGAAVLAQPLKDLRAFKTSVLGQIQSGVWMGWLFPSFIAHIIRELDYFSARLYGPGFSPEATLCANLQFLKEHAQFAAHLLDPTQASMIDQASTCASHLGSLQNDCMTTVTGQFLLLSKTRAMELDVFLRTSPITAASGTSVIHPVLAAHVIREGQRSIDTMEELQYV